MPTVDAIMKRYDEFVAKALSDDPSVSAEADHAYRDIWGLLDPEERQYISMARVDARDMQGDPNEFEAVCAEVRPRVMARSQS